MAIKTEQNLIETYQQAESFIMEALPMFQSVGKKAMGTYDLTRIRSFLDYLGNPQTKWPCIHIAGTNGKGSVSHMLAAVYQQNGYRTGLFTSPHLLTYRERIKINGSNIPEHEVLRWVKRHYDYLKESHLSFFEMSMGMAFSWFVREKTDIAIIETGLGGRLDATNVIVPLLSIITNIDLDHQDILGSDIEQISREKAGIIKPGVPVVLGNVDEAVEFVFEEASRKVEARLIRSDYKIVQRSETGNDGIEYSISKNLFSFPSINLPSLAPYQEYNLNTVLHALLYLRDISSLELNNFDIRDGLENFSAITAFRGRYEILNRQPLVIADAAHNPGGIRFFESLFQNKNVHLHLVIGLVKDKDLHQIFSLLPQEATYYFCAAKIPRAMDASQLQEEARKYGLIGEVWSSPRMAVESIIENANPDDVGLVLGSIYLLAEIL